MAARETAATTARELRKNMAKLAAYFEGGLHFIFNRRRAQDTAFCEQMRLGCRAAGCRCERWRATARVSCAWCQCLLLQSPKAVSKRFKGLVQRPKCRVSAGTADSALVDRCHLSLQVVLNRFLRDFSILPIPPIPPVYHQVPFVLFLGLKLLRRPPPS
jgi:hypothetical protein